MNEDKATRYHRLRRRAQLTSLAFVGTTLTAFVSAGGGAWLASGAAMLAGPIAASGSTARALAVVVAAVALALFLELVALPGACYVGCVLERRYGLSRQSTAEWWRDQLKVGGVGVVLAVAAASVVYGALDVVPSVWWLVAGLLLAALTALLVLGAPVVLLPLFYRLHRLPDGELSARLTSLAARAGTPVLGVYEWSLGDKSRTANAALVGLGPTRRILLSDTLLTHYTADEIEVVIAHELAHHVHGDIRKAVSVEAAQGTLALLVAHAALVWWGPTLGLVALEDLAGLPVIALAAGGWSVLTAPILLAQSRAHERRADRFALDLTTNASAFVSAMRRLGSQNLADDAPSRLVQWLFCSHPPLGARIFAAQRWALERGDPSPAAGPDSW